MAGFSNTLCLTEAEQGPGVTHCICLSANKNLHVMKFLASMAANHGDGHH